VYSGAYLALGLFQLLFLHNVKLVLLLRRITPANIVAECPLLLLMSVHLVKQIRDFPLLLRESLHVLLSEVGVRKFLRRNETLVHVQVF